MLGTQERENMPFKLAELFVDIEVDGVKSLNTKLNKAKANVQKLADGFGKLGSKISGIGKGFLKFGAVLSAPLILSIRQFAKMGDELDKMSRRTNVSVDVLSGLAFAASQSGASLEVLEKGIKGVQRNILDLERGLSTAKDNFDDLGISLDDIKGKTTIEQFSIIANALTKIEDPSRRAALAMKIFGKSGADLLPLMEQGASGINKMIAEAKRLGLIITPEQAAAAAELNDALDKVARGGMAILFSVGEALSGVVKDLATRISAVSIVVIKWVKENKKLVLIATAVVIGIFAIGAALVALGVVISVISIALGGLATAIGFVGTAMLFLAANPVGAVVLAIGLLVLAILALIGIFDGLSAVQKEIQKEMDKSTKSAKEQKKSVDALRKSAKDPIVIKTEIQKQGGDLPDPQAGLPGFLREDITELTSGKGLEVKFNTEKAKKELKEDTFELGATFSGIEDLFRNAQKSFAKSKADEINNKKTEENTKAVEKNTTVLNGLGRKLDVFGNSVSGGVSGMERLG